MHLKRKTAWSNLSLVGCRINCLVDLKEWHEGYVVQFHKSGKHLVEFRAANEKRWLMMKKIAFYIIERPAVPVGDASEYKDSGHEHDNLAPVEVIHLSSPFERFFLSDSLILALYKGILELRGRYFCGLCLRTISSF